VKNVKPEEAIEAMWLSIRGAVEIIKSSVDALDIAVTKRRPDAAGNDIQSILKQAIEIYTRIAVIAALEEIK